MPVHVVKVPEKLLWSHFKVRPNKIPDKRTNSLEEAFTRFHVNMPSGFIPKAMSGGFTLVFPDKWRITITPDAQLWKDANKTAELLAHEQIHYFFGFVTARALVNDFLSLQVKSKGEFRKAMFDLYDLHLLTRAGALNDQYESDTNHSANSSQQTQWENAMDTCLADDTATTLMGLPL